MGIMQLVMELPSLFAFQTLLFPSLVILLQEKMSSSRLVGQVGF